MTSDVATSEARVAIGETAVPLLDSLLFGYLSCSKRELDNQPAPSGAPSRQSARTLFRSDRSLVLVRYVSLHSYYTNAMRSCTHKFGLVVPFRLRDKND